MQPARGMTLPAFNFMPSMITGSPPFARASKSTHKGNGLWGRPFRCRLQALTLPQPRRPSVPPEAVEIGVAICNTPPMSDRVQRSGCGCGFNEHRSRESQA